MPRYVAIIEDAGPDQAVGIWFPDLPGCFSAGDDVDAALRNAEVAIALYADSLAADGKELPSPRPLSQLRNDPMATADLNENMVALVAFRGRHVDAAE